MSIFKFNYHVRSPGRS